MASVSECLRANARRLTARGKVTFASGGNVILDGEKILAIEIEEGAETLMPGSVLSGGYRLTLANAAGEWLEGGAALGQKSLRGATVEMEMGVLNGAEWEYLPMGVFVVQRTEAQEGAAEIKLIGSDSIASELSGLFTDGLTYPKTLAEVWAHAIGQTRYSWSGSVPNGACVIDAKPEWGNATLRRAISCIAAAAGAFVRVDRLGALELCPCREAGEPEEIGTQEYMELSHGEAAFGPVNAVTVYPTGGDGESVTVSTEGAVVSVMSTLRVEDNPLFQWGGEHLTGMCQGLLAAMSGMCQREERFLWRGDPAIRPGRKVRLTDRRGKATECVLTRVSQRFEQGYEAECSASAPEEDCGLMRAITPEGGVNGEALVGTVNGGLLAVGSVTARAIAAGTITAEKIASHTLDTDTIDAVTARINEITSQTLTTDELAAALAHFVEVDAEAGSFTFAQVQNLVSAALVVEQATGTDVYISNLAATYLQAVSATIGNLVIKAEGGGYYALSVGAGGAVTATEVTPTAAEIAAGAAGGKPIIETDITADSLSTATLSATNALVNKLTAARIDVAELFARQATIDQIKTMSVSSVDNGSTLFLGEQAVRISTPAFSVEIAGDGEASALRIDQDGVMADELSTPNDIGGIPYAAKRYGADAGSHTITAFSQITDLLNDRVLDRDIVVNCDTGARIPAEYQEVDYIQSSGTQYIQLSFGFDPTDEIETRFSVDVAQTTDKYMVAPQTWNDNTNRFGMGVHDEGRYTVGYGSRNTASSKLNPYTINDGELHNWRYANAAFYVLDLNLSIDVSDRSFGGTTANLKLFYGYNSNTSGKIASYKHKKNGALVCDLVPCVRISDNAVGMYDAVTQTFLTNAGTEAFVSGSPADLPAWPDAPTIRGVTGSGSITIHGSGVQVLGAFRITDCTCRVAVDNLYANFTVTRSPYVAFTDCTKTGTVSGTVTEAFPATVCRTFRTAGTTYYGSGAEFYQGATYAYAQLLGHMWFGGATALAGKTIRAARLTVKRMAGIGGGTAAGITAYTSDKTSPEGTGYIDHCTLIGDLGSIANGEQKTFDIPASAIPAIAAGGALVFFTGEARPGEAGHISGRYAKFYGAGEFNPVLTVTYEDTVTETVAASSVTYVERPLVGGIEYDTGRITVTAAKNSLTEAASYTILADGLYQINACAGCPSSTSGSYRHMQVDLVRDGVSAEITGETTAPMSGARARLAAAIAVEAKAGDEIKLAINQDSSSATIIFIAQMQILRMR